MKPKFAPHNVLLGITFVCMLGFVLKMMPHRKELYDMLEAWRDQENGTIIAVYIYGNMLADNGIILAILFCSFAGSMGLGFYREPNVLRRLILFIFVLVLFSMGVYSFFVIEAVSTIPELYTISNLNTIVLVKVYSVVISLVSGSILTQMLGDLIQGKQRA